MGNTDRNVNSKDTCDCFEIIGELTVYAARPNGGNCGLDWNFIEEHQLKAMTHFVALPKGEKNAYQYHMNCGRCVKFRCSCDQHKYTGHCQTGRETIAMVTDSCPSCHILGDLDLSNAAWDEVTGNETPSRYDGSYEFVPCPDEFLANGKTRLRFKEGSSKHWTVLQPFNHMHKIEHVEFRPSNKAEFQTALFPKDVLDSFYFKIDAMNMPVEVCVINAVNSKGCITLTTDTDFKATYELDALL